MGKNKFYVILFTITTVVLTGGIFYVLAAPPASPYAPGETLAPTCAPGSLNCTVTPPAMSGANSDITSFIGSALTIGDATTDRLTILSQLLGSEPIVFQGSTDDENYLTIGLVDPTDPQTIIFPDASGTVITTGNTSNITDLSPSNFTTNNISQWTNDAGYITGSVSSALSDITAATGANSIENGDNAQTWNWTKTTAGSGLILSDNDTSGLTPATHVLELISQSGSNAMPLHIKNYGTGRSFQVDDEATDLTQFFIDEEGRMVLGSDVSNPLAKMTVNSDASFTNSIAATGSVDQNLNIAVRNSSATALATSLFAASADNVSEVFAFDNSAAFGVTSSVFSNPLQNLAGPNDVFLLGTGNDVFVGNGTPFYVDPTSAIRFVVGGQQDNITLPPGAPYFGAPTGINGEKMRIATNGSVGINTMTPAATLDIKQYTANYFGAAPDALHLSGSTSGYVGFNPPAVAGSTTYTLPAADGANGDALTTDGSGILSWSPAASKFQRVGIVLSPSIAGDDISTNTTGNIYTASGSGGTITSDGLLTGNTGLTVIGGAVNLNASSNFNTNINTGTSTGLVSIGNSLSGAVGITSGAALTLTGGTASSFSTIAGAITLQPAGAGTTSSVQIGVGGVGSITPDLLALDVKSDAGDPAGFDGSMYYSEFLNEFRCFVAGSWNNCDTTGGTATLQSAYNAGNDIVTHSARDIELTLTSGNFTASGAGSVLLTPTGASSFTSGGALTLTGGAASTWGTSTGDLSLVVGGTGSANVQIGDGGATSATPDLLVLDIGSAEPTGTNGAMYYSTALSKLRCFEAGGWKDCDTGAGAGDTLQQAYTAGSTITTTGNDLAVILNNGDFTVTGNDSVLLTPTSASSFTSGGALTLTGGSASTWGTTSGDLTLQVAGAGTGSLKIGTGGAGTTTPDLLALDVKSSTGDPAGFEGAMYYNNFTSKFRCFEDLAWKDCDAGAVATMQDAYDNGSTITTSGSNPITFNLTSGDFNINGGLVNISGLTASQVVFTDASKNLTSTGTVSIAQGGTGQTTKTAAFDALSPTTTKGDLIVRDTTNNIRLGVGTNGQVLTANSATATGLQWSSVSVADDSLNFSNFNDVMALDASTNIGFGTGALSLTFTNNGTGNEVHNLTSTGDLVIQDNGVTFATFADDGSITFTNLTVTNPINGSVTGSSGSTTGNAATATALAANPSDCALNTFANAIDASGNLTCAAITVDAGSLTGTTLAANVVNSSLTSVGTLTNLTVAGDVAVNGGDITSTSTALNITVGNTGTISFTDGTNTLVSILDKGTFGTLKLSDKGSTGDPATCTVGEMYFNATDAVFKGCTATNVWTTFSSQQPNVATSTQTNSVALSTTITSIGTVTITRRSTASRVWLTSSTQVNSGSNTNEDVTFTIRSGAGCAGTAIYTQVQETDNLGEQLGVALNFVDTPGVTNPFTYTLCAISTSNLTTVTNRTLTAQEVNQ